MEDLSKRFKIVFDKVWEDVCEAFILDFLQAYFLNIMSTELKSLVTFHNSLLPGIIQVAAFNFIVQEPRGMAAVLRERSRFSSW